MSNPNTNISPFRQLLQEFFALKPCPASSSPILQHRHEIFYGIAIVGTILLLPFTINNFIQDRYLLGIGTLMILTVLLSGGIAIHHEKQPPLPIGLLFPTMLYSSVVATLDMGIQGSIWGYPTLIISYFIFSVRFANLLNLVLTIALVYATSLSNDMGATMRLGGTLILSMLMVNVFLNKLLNLQIKLEALTREDPLTGTYNRRHMAEQITQLTEQVSRYQQNVSVILFDVDHFKTINDRYGHEKGDQVLKAVADMVQQQLRLNDTLCRYGGEEFVVILPETDLLHAMETAEKLRLVIEDSKLLEDRPLTASFGVAQVIPHEALNELFKRCDIAMYKAKQIGRNSIIEAPEPAH